MWKKYWRGMGYLVTDRYDTSGSHEGQCQSGSDDRVLLNKLGITDPAEMDDIELDLLEQLTEDVVVEFGEDQVTLYRLVNLYWIFPTWMSIKANILPRYRLD